MGEVRGAQTDVTAQAAHARHVTSRRVEERKVDSILRANLKRVSNWERGWACL